MLDSRTSKRKATGGLRTSVRASDKRLSELANKPSDTTLSHGVKEKRHMYRGKGGNIKVRALKVNKANVSLDGRVVFADILAVVKNSANKDFVRRNVITKGAQIKVSHNGTEFNAKVTSRPGQSGVIFAVKI